MKMRAFEFVLRRLMIGYRRRQILVKAQLTGQIAEMPLYVADELPYILAPPHPGRKARYPGSVHTISVSIPISTVSLFGATTHPAV